MEFYGSVLYDFDIVTCRGADLSLVHCRRSRYIVPESLESLSHARANTSRRSAQMAQNYNISFPSQ